MDQPACGDGGVTQSFHCDVSSLCGSGGPGTCSPDFCARSCALGQQDRGKSEGGETEGGEEGFHGWMRILSSARS